MKMQDGGCGPGYTHLVLSNKIGSFVSACIRKQIIEVNGANVSVITDISNGSASTMVGNAVVAIVMVLAMRLLGN